MRFPRMLSALLAAAVLACIAGTAAADEAADATAAAAAETREKTRQVLAYGIDPQVLDVISRLRASRDAGYTVELTALLAETRSPDVRKAVLELFTELGVRDGEPAARAIVAGWETGTAAVTSAAAAYLSSLRAEGLGTLLLPLVDADDAVVCAAALRAIGASRDPAAVMPLLGKLASVEFPDARKGDLVVALGELRDARAVDALIRIAKGRDEDKTRRLYAADALGKIGDRRALPVLLGMFDEDDALLRAYAASALAAFGMGEALPSLLAGLRDANVKVRLQCTKALARELEPAAAAQVVPIVRWKAENDPERTVRLESVRTLGEIADGPSVAFLEALLANRTAALDFREAALSALLARTPSVARHPRDGGAGDRREGPETDRDDRPGAVPREGCGARAGVDPAAGLPELHGEDLGGARAGGQWRHRGPRAGRGAGGKGPGAGRANGGGPGQGASAG